jgi:predicted membrane protein
MLEQILLLIFAHFIGDFPLQGDFLGTQKANSNFLLFVHCFIYTGVISIAFILMGFKFDIFITLFILGNHYYSDFTKCRKVDKSEALTTDLYIDQASHMIQLAVAYLLYCLTNG